MGDSYDEDDEDDQEEEEEEKDEEEESKEEEEEKAAEDEVCTSCAARISCCYEHQSRSAHRLPSQYEERRSYLFQFRVFNHFCKPIQIHVLVGRASQKGMVGCNEFSIA